MLYLYKGSKGLSMIIHHKFALVQNLFRYALMDSLPDQTDSRGTY